jgi:signal transduction histidine kinase
VPWKDVLAELRRLMARPDWPVLSGVALGIAAVLEAVAWTGGAPDSGASLAVALNLFATAPLIARRTHLPAVAAIVTLATLWLVLDAATLSVAAIVAQTWVIYLVAVRYRWWAWLPMLAPYVVYGMSPSHGEDAGATAAGMLVLAVSAAAIGATRRARGAAAAERDVALREQAAMGERARIARELHDVVAHHISMIVVEADTARLATADMPDEGRARLLSIRDIARDAMDEMRHVLGVLRDDAGADAEHAPQPGLDQLAELIDAAREAGTHVRLIVHGRVVPLSPGVDLAAYRIVQEALTNARKHAPGATVDVELGYTSEALKLRVSDDGPGSANGDPRGLGLLGMRERVATVGGTLRTGTAEGGGFAVEADLPLAP